ncbi:MAG: hypothetical protein HFACDABA_03141 [Anaerolineales bacterium]|nr:hypothetical protein [Anaerolineales bacterium]
MTRAARPFLLIGIAWMILLCGCAALTMIWPGWLTRWEQAPALPESAARLSLGQAGEVLAVASNGTVYELRYGTYQADSSWGSGPSGAPAIGMHCAPAQRRNLILPPPGKVVSRVGESCAYMESSYRLEAVLLENGEVWTWEHERYAYAELFTMCGLLAAFVMGVPFFAMAVGLKITQKIKKIPE